MAVKRHGLLPRLSHPTFYIYRPPPPRSTVSAYWLRSSVVTVLLSLTAQRHITRCDSVNQSFRGGAATRPRLRGRRRRACGPPCTHAARAHPTLFQSQNTNTRGRGKGLRRCAALRPARARRSAQPAVALAIRAGAALDGWPQRAQRERAAGCRPALLRGACAAPTRRLAGMRDRRGEGLCLDFERLWKSFADRDKFRGRPREGAPRGGWISFQLANDMSRETLIDHVSARAQECDGGRGVGAQVGGGQIDRC